VGTGPSRRTQRPGTRLLDRHDRLLTLFAYVPEREPVWARVARPAAAERGGAPGHPSAADRTPVPETRPLRLPHGRPGLRAPTPIPHRTRGIHMRAQLHRLVFLAVILTTGPALAGPGVWTSGGPEGGTIYDLAVHPSQPDTIFLGALTGIYKSTDTGATWIPLNPAPYSAILRSLRVSPHDSQLLMVSSDSQLLRSTDGGDNWTPLDGGLPLPTSFS